MVAVAGLGMEIVFHGRDLRVGRGMEQVMSSKKQQYVVWDNAYCRALSGMGSLSFSHQFGDWVLFADRAGARKMVWLLCQQYVVVDDDQDFTVLTFLEARRREIQGRHVPRWVNAIGGW